MEPDLEKGDTVKVEERQTTTDQDVNDDDNIQEHKPQHADDELERQATPEPNPIPMFLSGADVDGIIEVARLRAPSERVRGTSAALSVDPVLERLYRLEYCLARFELVKFYIRKANNTRSVSLEERFNGLEPHLSKHVAAMRNYVEFLDLSGVPSAPRLQHLERLFADKVYDAAYETVALEEYEEHKDAGHLEDDKSRRRFEACRQQRDRRIESLLEGTRFGDDGDLQASVRKQMIKTKNVEIHIAATKFLRKICMAIFGGLSLIVPVLIMVLHPTLLTALVTTSVFVLFVGTVLAAVMVEAEPKDVVAATAAYAAVLVVFIGTSGGGSNASDNAGGADITNNSTANTTAQSTSMSKGQVGGITAGSIGAVLITMFAIWGLWAAIASTTFWIPLPIPGLTQLYQDMEQAKLQAHIVKENERKQREQEEKERKKRIEKQQYEPRVIR